MITASNNAASLASVFTSLLADDCLTTNTVLLCIDLQWCGLPSLPLLHCGDCLTTASDSDWSVCPRLPLDWLALLGRSVKLLLDFASKVIPGFSLVEIHDQDFYSILDIYVFQNLASSSSSEQSVFLCRRYVCCTIVLARVYPHCHGIQITMDSVHPCHWTILSNIYAWYTEVSC
jgi:hypothetical protein